MGEKKKEHFERPKDNPFAPSYLFTSTKSQGDKKAGLDKLPYAKNIKRFFIDKEFFMILLLLGTFAGVTTLIFYALWIFVKPLFLWVVGFFALFLSRRTDMWYVGIEVHFLLTFLFTYLFGLWFSLPLVYLSFSMVFKFRPDQFHGIIIHMISLTFLAILTRFMFGVYGPGISQADFSFMFLIIIMPTVILNFILSIKFAPADPIKAGVIHTLTVFIEYYVATYLGYPALQFLYGLGLGTAA